MTKDEALRQIIESQRDMLAGWKYIRDSHGDLYGVGWNRAQEKAESALAAAREALAEQPAAPAVLTDAEIEAWADGFIRKEAYHRPTAVSLAREAARFVLARAIPPGCVVAKDEPVAYQYLFDSQLGGEVWRWSADNWNGSKPKATRALYARPGAPK